MKINFIRTAIVVTMLFISFNSYAQNPDVFFDTGTTAASYSINVGDFSTDVLIPFRVNSDGLDTTGTITAEFTHSFELIYNSSSASNSIPANWTCFSQTPGTVCSTSTVMSGTTGTFVDFILAFNIGSTTPVSFYQIDGLLTESSGFEFSSNNSMITGIDVIAGASPPDLKAELIDVDGFIGLGVLDFEEGSFTSQTAHMSVTNDISSGPAANGATLSLSYEDINFSLNESVGTVPAGWSCSVVSTGQLDCITNIAINAGAVIDFFFEYTPIQSLSPTTYSPLSAFISDTDFAEPSMTQNDNFLSIPVSVFAASTLDIQFDDINTSTFVSIPFGVLSNQTLSYQIVNNGADSFGGAEVYFAYDDTKFSLTASTASAGWTCGIVTIGTYACDTFNNFPSAATADFTVQFAVLGSTAAGFYSPGIIADVFPIFGGAKTKRSNPVIKALVGNQIITDIGINALEDPDIVIDKTFGNGFNFNTVTEAAAGSLVTYKILVDALDTCGGFKNKVESKGCFGTAPGSNVQITDNLPAGVSFSSLNMLGPNFSCTESAGIISCSATSLPITTADDGVEITVLVTGNPGDIITNTATVTADNDFFGSNNSSSPGTFTVTATLPTTLSVSKQALVLGVPVDSVPKGSAFSYRIAVENTGSSSAINLQLDDDMPLGILVNNAFGAGWSCNNMGQLYTCNYPGSLLAGATTFLTFDVVDNTATDVVQILNVVNASAANAPLVNGALFTSLTDVSFELNITQNPNPIEENQPFEFIIDITNTGTEEINGAEVANMLPDGFSYSTAAKISSCSINGLEMLCTVDTPIAVGATETINFGVQAISVVDTNATYTNITTISGGNIPAPISISTVTNVNATGAGAGGYNYDIQLTSDIVETVETDTPYLYTVTLENTGSLDITFMDVNIDLPPDLVIVSMMTNGFTCTQASFGLSCTADPNYSLSPNAISEIIVIEVQSSTFTGEILVDLNSNIGTVLNRNTNTTTTIVSGTVVSDLSVLVSSGNPIDQGDMSEFEINVVNDGPDAAEDVSVTIDVTGILDDITVNPSSDWECQVDGSAIDCQFKLTLMPEGHQSSIFVTANTTQVVIDAEDLELTAEVETISSDPDLGNNIASSSVGVTGTPTEGDIADALRDALGIGNPEINDAIDAVSALCEIQFYTAFEELCESLYDAANDGDRDAIARFIDEITPREVIGQSTSLNEIALAQFRNIGARLNQIRGGGGSGFSSAGLNARYGSGSIPLGMLAYLNQTEEEAAAAEINTNNDFISPWGFFVNGSISMGERDATGRELGFDFDTFGLTAGFDYRIDAKKVVGVAIGYANFDSKIEGSAELNSTGVTLTGYGSFYVNDNFYVDARISLGTPDFEQSRKIDFTLGSTHFERTAVGDTSANQYTASMSAGYSFYKNSWNITPNASFTYTTTDVDSFTESGAGDFNIAYSDQEIESLVWSAGVRVSKAISLKNGVITPQFDFDYNYQGLNDESLIEVRFINSPESQSFYLETDSPDRTYGSAGAGLVFISANGKQAYINYRSVLGLDGFSRGTYNIGARFEF